MSDFLDAYSIQYWLESGPQAYLALDAAQLGEAAG